VLIYSNSCSYGVVSNGPVYSDFIANQFDAELINHGSAGSCNERIFRTSTRDILKILNKHGAKDILVLIGLTNTFRGEFWGTTPASHQDGHFQSFTATSAVENYTQEFYKMYDQEAAITNLLSQLVVFSGWLKHLNIRYLVWANSMHIKPINFTENFIEPFYKNVSQDTGILPLFDFNFCELAQQNGYQTIDQPYEQGGHPDTQAHKHFSDFLITKLRP
jgi:hypothetical protein